MRTIDYIATRPDLDSSRVGCMGISGGGTATLFRRGARSAHSRVAMVSGYLNTFRDSVGSLAHCVDNYVPGILNWAEMHDIAGLIAPRPLFVESGEQGSHLSAASERRELSAPCVRSIRSSGPRIASSRRCFPDEHAFWGKRGFPSSRGTCGFNIRGAAVLRP